MKKLSLILLVTSFIASTAFAVNPCTWKLTYGHEKDSMAYTIDQDELELPEYGNDYVAESIAVIRGLLEMRGCSQSDINFKKTPIGRNAVSRCTQIVRGIPTSRTCYIESSLGYFSLSKDMLTSVHVVFNRWD